MFGGKSPMGPEGGTPDTPLTKYKDSRLVMMLDATSTVEPAGPSERVVQL
jgi:hypothetical protein